MKKIFLLAFAIGLLYGIGCKNSGQETNTNINPPQQEEETKTVYVIPACSVADIGENKQFTYKVFDENGVEMLNIQDSDITWTSSDETLATVIGGFASAIGGGNVFIKAKYTDITGEALLFVSPILSEHNCKPYEWYRSQSNTGYASSNNCGPTSTHMAIKWFRNTADGIPTVAEIRDRHPNNGGWWSTDDISESFNFYNVSFAVHSVSIENDILACLQRGNIVLLCVEMKWITYDRHKFYDRFYTFDSGHFLIVKGWSEDGEYFIVYDPNSWSNDFYDDGTMMGRNRYYKVGELLSAVTEWWPYAFEIGAPSSTSTVDLQKIPTGRAGPLHYK